MDDWPLGSLVGYVPLFVGIALHDVGGRTRISQSFRVLRAPKVLRVVYALLIPSHRDRTAELRGDLERLGVAARGSSG